MERALVRVVGRPVTVRSSRFFIVMSALSTA